MARFSILAGVPHPDGLADYRRRSVVVLSAQPARSLSGATIWVSWPLLFLGRDTVRSIGRIHGRRYFGNGPSKHNNPSSRETSNLKLLSHLAEILEPTTQPLAERICTYAKAVVQQEWPTMLLDGEASPTAETAPGQP